MNGMARTASGISSGRISGSERAAAAGTSAGSTVGGRGDGRRRQHQPDQHRPGVAHEDPGRGEVVRQEPDAGAGERGGQQGRRGGDVDVVRRPGGRSR